MINMASKKRERCVVCIIYILTFRETMCLKYNTRACMYRISMGRKLERNKNAEVPQLYLFCRISIFKIQLKQI